MKTAPPVTSIPGKMMPNQGPYKKDMGAIPEKTKSHSVPARKEVNGNKAMKNQGPSKMDMGAIPAKTKSHSVPSHEETMGGMQAGGMMPPVNQSGEGHMSVSSPNADVHKSWKKKGYSMNNMDGSSAS
jgi:hypothetical protein